MRFWKYKRRIALHSDLRAQIAANHVGAAGIRRMMDEFELNTLTELSQAVSNRSEKALRKAIATLPDGAVPRTDYVYHLPHCVFNQLYADNATVRAAAAALGATGVLPPAYQNNTYLRYDFGGDAGLPELSLMVLDWYEHTMYDDGMRRYLPLLVGTLDFFAQHYGVVAATGTLLLFPTQALETYQCPFSWPPSLATCPANDHPTVTALHVLTERALALPEGLTTAAQRDPARIHIVAARCWGIGLP